MMSESEQLGDEAENTDGEQASEEQQPVKTSRPVRPAGQ